MPSHEDALAWAEEHLGPVTDVRALEGGRTSTMLALTPRDGESAVLRLMTEEPWRTHGVELTTRERDTQRLLDDTPVPAPRTLALDATGVRCGQPAHLMTRLPGRLELQRSDAASLGLLADLLVVVHEVEPSVDVRTFQSWAWEAKYVVPAWASDPGPWEDAFALLRTPVPTYDRTFLHRDFGPHNVLWADGRVSGLVDWVETSVGPAWLDVAHAATNLALRHGNAVADAFAAAYVERTGRVPEPYLDVMDVVGFLPPPGRASLVTDPPQLARLDERLRAVLARVT
ncbi:aminoglycoside phosphotransferase family protein [Nocardioides sp. HDW12B]|uniref:phosphotransferase family protein n=1 Tax=Nocardioides sp. HDW12B TaxID=2714939 RepID=UPI00140A8D65|nr:aminoglycoside phosphotransferase family protein [Nocardioides sp. HDW12B]QIK67840.1 aminoglycoside phosphotransferase family protein [Nocardioides sp. HDW12B]